jgi:hypothetical protein
VHLIHYIGCGQGFSVGFLLEELNSWVLEKWRNARRKAGIKDIATTLRYAHLAPQHKAEAVEKLLDITTESSEEI